METSKEFVVDLWKTDAHKVEVGIKKEAELRAKSRQYTQDTEIYGEIELNGEERGYVTYRKDPWEADLINRRLVVKHFTQGISWKGSLEEVVSRSLAKTISADKGLPSFIINLSKSENLITMEKIQRHGSFDRSIYAVTVLDEESNSLLCYSIETDRFTMGSDWNVFDQNRDKIAEVDGSRFNIGGKYTIRIDEKNPFYAVELDDILILFAAANKFLSDLDDKLEKTVKQLQKDKMKLTLDKSEAMLFLNPRRVAV